MCKVSVIVLNYNDHETTTKYIEAIKNYDNITNIIVVDNNSTDNSYEILKKYQGGNIDVIETNRNGGYGFGNNEGVRFTIKNHNPEYIIISNPDVFYDKSVVEEMISAYRENEKAAIVAPTMLIDNKIMWAGCKIPTYKNDLIFSSYLLLNKFGDSSKYDKSHFQGKYSEVEVVPGSFFMIKSSIMEEVDYFDEDFFLYCEERIISKKVLDKGYKNFLINDVFYDHQHSVSISKSIDSEISRYMLLASSRFKYQKKYNNIGIFKMAILKSAYNIMALRMKMASKKGG